MQTFSFGFDYPRLPRGCSGILGSLARNPGTVGSALQLGSAPQSRDHSRRPRGGAFLPAGKASLRSYEPKVGAAFAHARWAEWRTPRVGTPTRTPRDLDCAMSVTTFSCVRNYLEGRLNMPRKTDPAKPPNAKTTTPSPRAAFIDDALMKRAIALYAEGKTMNEVGEAVGVKATAYLAKKIRATYGPDALVRGAAQGSPQTTAAKPASAPAKRAARKPATEGKG